MLHHQIKTRINASKLDYIPARDRQGTARLEILFDAYHEANGQIVFVGIAMGATSLEV